MYRYLGAVLGLAVFSSSCLASRADDKDKEARAVIDKAVKAMGGAEKLTRAEMASWRVEHKSFSAAGTAYKFTLHIIEGSNGRSRKETETEERNGEISKSVTVMNGDKAWRTGGGKIRVLSEEVVLGMKRSDEMFDAARRPVILKSPRIFVRMAGEQKIGDRTAVVLEVIGTFGQEFNLFFDKESGLPMRLEARVMNLNNQVRTIEATFTDYKDFDGVRLATRIMQTSNGVKGSEAEITEFKVLEKVAPETFDEPT